MISRARPGSVSSRRFKKPCAPNPGATESKLVGIESLRGLLALTVFLAHCWLVFVAPANGDATTDAHVALMILSRLAVVLFFVVSGFTIAMSIGQNRMRHGGRFDGWEYALARGFRIVPPLAATIVLTYVLYVVLLYWGVYYVSWQSAERRVFVTYPKAQWLSLATLTTYGDLRGGSNGPLWSLNYEIRLYVAAGLVALVAANRRWWAILVLAAYIQLLARLPVPDVLRQTTMLAAFAIGAAAHAARDASSRACLAAALVTFAVLSALLSTFHFGDGRWALDSPSWLAGQLLAATLFAAGVVVAARSTSSWFGLHHIGTVSYTLYILHFPVLLALYFALFNEARPLVMRGTVQWTVVPVGLLALAACAALGRWIERPKQQRRWADSMLQKLRRRWPSSLKGARAARDRGLCTANSAATVETPVSSGMKSAHGQDTA